MSISLPKKVGNVPIDVRLKPSDQEYSDGDSENVLLELFKSKDAEKKRQELLAGNPEWRLKYHIAYTRENILNWYEFGPSSKLLEVGSGIGAVTRVFINQCAQVDAIDISPRRSLINAYRNRNAENLKIIVGNIENLKGSGYYDYVTSIGVLEYAGRFVSGKNPYVEFLKQLHGQLKPGGTLVLAIENKLGIKYWSGSREDHLGQIFAGIENYPHDTGVRTFGRTELEVLLARAGFSNAEFYYPFPDYKMPLDIYSDAYHTGVNGTMSSDLFPTPNPDQPREFLFAEDLALNNLAENGLFPFFANSFLVFAQKGTA